MSDQAEHRTDALRKWMFVVYALIIAVAAGMRFLTVGPFVAIQGILSLLLFNSFVGSLCLAFFLSYLGLPLKKGELARVVGLGLVLEGGLLALRLRWPQMDAVLAVLTLGVGMGVASLALGLLPRHWRGGGAEVFRRWACPALILMSYFVGHFTVGVVAQLSPLVHDLGLFDLDLAYGCPNAFTIRQWLDGHGPVDLLLRAVYGSLALAMVIAQLHFLARPRRYHLDPTLCFVLLGTVGGALYFLCPVVGPQAFFKTFPNVVPPALPIQTVPFGDLDVPRNSIPSLHISWALSCLWTTWSAHRGLRMGMAVFLALTLPASLAIGSHYLIDLVVSFPMTMGVHSLLVWAAEVLRQGKDRRLRRWSLGAALVGLFWTVMTILLVREQAGWLMEQPILLWIWTALSVGGAWALEGRVRLYSGLGRGVLPH